MFSTDHMSRDKVMLHSGTASERLVDFRLVCATAHSIRYIFYWCKRLVPVLSIHSSRWFFLEPLRVVAVSSLTLRVWHIVVKVLPDFDAHVLAPVFTVLEARC